VPGGAAGLQNQSGGRKVPGGFDSLPSPPENAAKTKVTIYHSELQPIGSAVSELLSPLQRCKMFKDL
jgi:hypothetical protein